LQGHVDRTQLIEHHILSSFKFKFSKDGLDPNPLAAMPAAYPLPSDLSPATVTNTASLLRIVALALISSAAIASRLFAVINFESIIHELYVLAHQYLVTDNELPTATHGLTST